MTRSQYPGADTPARQDPWRDSLGKAGTRAAQVLLLLVLAVVAVYALIQVRLVVIPMLLALILAAAIGPFVNWLRRKGWNASLATAVSFLLLLLIFGGLITGIVFAVMGQADELATSATEGFDKLYAFVQNGPIPVDDAQIQQARDWVVDFATSSTVGAGAISGLSAAGNFVAGALLMVVILFFFLKDGEKIWAFMLRAFKGKRLVKARRVGYSSMAVLGGYVRGTAIVALVDSLFIGLALFFLDVPLALPLAAIVFVGAFVPLVGATLAGVLAALIALVANGPFVALLVVIAVIVVNQLEGNFLQPVVMGRTLQVHALVILVALTAGTILAGIIGAILSVPVAAVGWAAIKAWNEERDEDITDEEVEDAERRTALDETGHGLSSTPKHEHAEKEEAAAVAVAEADERPGTQERRVEGYDTDGKDTGSDSGHDAGAAAAADVHDADTGTGTAADVPDTGARRGRRSRRWGRSGSSPAED
ncbi:AI-2E family transporter [Arthrobacter agilis]|uniref:AI-2E family transporter n=1 Tax=Arthrobacter agilis TaxID=37921 RepID=UPI000B34DE07|nr:AI-2E family transporter [Arthrobacter agilis]PPB45330.1 AI-2E family transporter [Arthrobacter agilis]TPV28039.1 AI-2E family transporter [Arthrobacter agilis]VDR31265.1 pheromone autoinducer 2 transporter [Arthrobacter agilis]